MTLYNLKSGKYQDFAPSLAEMINQALFINLQFNLLFFLWSIRFFPSSTTVILNIVFALQNLSIPQLKDYHARKEAWGYSRFLYFPLLTFYTFFTWIKKGPYGKSDKILNMNHFYPQLAENSAHVVSQLC